MDVFSYMNNIWFNDIQEFMKNVDNHRDDMLLVDESLLLKKHTIDVDNIEELSNGILHSFYEGYQFDCFFYRKESQYLYVILNGALTGKKPQFNRWSYYSFLDGSVLDIADPMYEKYAGLELGWYYGTDKENLRLHLANYVKKIADYLQVRYDRVIFWGSSGGGAATLECANYIKGATAVAINPQILLKDYSYSCRFEEITKNKLSKDQWHRTDGIYQLKKGRHILLMNLRDKSDMEQMKKICETLKIKIRYGINIFGDLIIWIYDCDLGQYCSAHNLQENYCICFVIEWLVHHFNDKAKLEEMDSIFRLVNEFWSYRYRLELEWRNRKPDFAQIKECIQSPKSVVIWGSGKIGEKVFGDVLDVEGSNYLNIQFVIDNDKSLNGKKFHGIKITKPDSVNEWEKLFIIIAIENAKNEIAAFLKSKGLLYKADFIFYNDLYANVKVL